MMDKSLVGHSALAVIAGVAAYVAWTKPAASRFDPNVMVVAGSPDRLTQIEWDESGFHVTVDQKDGKLWVASTVKNAKDEKRNIKDFPASDKGRELVEKLVPLKAERSLGKPEGPRLKEVGLDTPNQTLTLHFGDQATKLEVGNPTFGASSYYVRNPSGEVFLLPAADILPLKAGAAGLIERLVVNLTREHVEQVKLTIDGATRTLVQKNAGDRAQSFFSDPDNADIKIDKAATWVDAALRLRALSATTEMPTTEPRLTILVRGDDGKERSMKIWEPANETATVVSQTFPKGVQIAKSAADVLLKDAKTLLGEGATSEAPPAHKP
jgi:hypothetical protein